MSWEDVLKVKDYDEREEGRDECCKEAMKMYLKNEPNFLDKTGLASSDEVKAMDCEQFHSYLQDLLQDSNKDKGWYFIVKTVWNYKKRCDQNRQFFTPEGGRPMASDDFGRTDPYEEGQRRFRREFR